MVTFRLLACAAALSLSGAAAASSSDPFRTDGATLRLVTTGLADANGRLRGALEIALDPGWKTYWKEPGASGVPPQVDVSASLNVEAARFHFPAPEWHEDVYGAWAGYGRPVVLPVTFTVGVPDRYSLVEADLFLGICEDVCIPVQARLTVEPGSAPEDPADAALVDAAFAALPAEPRDGFAISAASLDGDTLTLSAHVPEGAPPSLFLAPPPGHGYGKPRVASVEEGQVLFEVPVLARPAAGGAATIDYVLVAGENSVSGSFTLP